MRWGPTLQPDAVLAKMVWQGSGSRNGTAQVDPFMAAFKMNSLKQPGVAMAWLDTYTASVDPLSTLQTQYSQYVVYASKIELHVANLSSSQMLTVSTFPYTSSAYANLGANVVPFINAPMNQWACLAPNGTDGSYQCLKNYQAIHKVWSTSKEDVMIDSGFQSTTTTPSDPTKICFWLFNISGDATSPYVTFSVRVKITYYVKFFQRYSLQT